MKKLNLNVDQLSVETFEAQAVPAGRGTVRGHIWSDPNLTCDSDVDPTCHGHGTCGVYPCRPL